MFVIDYSLTNINWSSRSKFSSINRIKNNSKNIKNNKYDEKNNKCIINNTNHFIFWLFFSLIFRKGWDQMFKTPQTTLLMYYIAKKTPWIDYIYVLINIRKYLGLLPQLWRSWKNILCRIIHKVNIFGYHLLVFEGHFYSQPISCSLN